MVFPRQHDLLHTRWPTLDSSVIATPRVLVPTKLREMKQGHPGSCATEGHRTFVRTTPDVKDEPGITNAYMHARPLDTGWSLLDAGNTQLCLGRHYEH